MAVALRPRTRIGSADQTRREYHLRIVTEDDANQRFCNKVDDLLDGLFQGNPSLEVDAPLARSTYENETVVLVRFKLSSQAQSRNVALKSAFDDFCRFALAKKNKNRLGSISPEMGVLGLSPVSRDFKHCWNKALFANILTEGPNLLHRIQSTITKDYVPLWATMVSFAAASDNIFAFLNSDFRGKALEALKALQSLGPKGPLIASIGLAVLDLVMDYFKGPSAASLASFDAQMKAVKVKMDLVMSKCAEMRDAIMNPEVDEDLSPDSELFDALCDATEQASQAVLSNDKVWKAYRQAWDINNVQRIGNIAGIGLGGAAGAAAITEVVTLTVTSTAAPLSSWTLGSYAGLLLYGETPMVYTAATATATAVCWPLLLTGLAVSAFHLGRFVWHTLEEKELKKQLLRHENVHAVLMASWKVMWMTKVLLHLIHNTSGGRPEDVGFVNDEARKMWNEFVAYMQSLAPGRTLTAQPSSAQSVALFVQEQRVMLKTLREKLE